MVNEPSLVPPAPSPTTKRPKGLDSRILGLMDSTSKFADAIDHVEKSQKAILKRYKGYQKLDVLIIKAELEKLFEDIGESMNTFSLEYEPLAGALDKTGQYFDRSSSNLPKVVSGKFLREQLFPLDSAK